MNARLILAAAVVATSPTLAGITPSWRINPITPGAIALEPRLIGALSLSLMVELDGGSLFNFGGLDLNQQLPGARYFQHPSGTTAQPPPLWLPPDVGFDTYVSTTNPDQWAAVPGPLNGVGAAQIGDVGFNIAWGATPNTGGVGPREIARITFLASNGFSVAAPGQGVTLPLDQGLVADSINPNTLIALPPLPIVVPEPAAVLSVGALMLFKRQHNS